MSNFVSIFLSIQTISKYYAFKASDEKYKEEKIKDVVVDYGV